jgi:hypothetical protein
MSEEKPKKRTGPGYNVSEPRDISGEIPLGMPTPKGKPLPDPNAEAKKAVKKAREQTAR